MYELILQPKARNDLDAHIKVGHKILVAKIYRIFEELEQDPYEGIGKPHKMRYYQGENVWSRRIDSRHRMLYRVDDGVVTVFVIALWGHYDDK